MSSGSSAPTVKASMDAQAACHGLVRLSGSMPNSMSAWARSASCSVSSRGDLLRGLRRQALLDVHRGELALLGLAASARSSAASRPRIDFSESRWVLTETYSPVPMLRAPAVRAAMPAITIAPLSSVAPATPITTPAVETMPSLAPSTAARSQLSRVPTLSPSSSWKCRGSSSVPISSAHASDRRSQWCRATKVRLGCPAHDVSRARTSRRPRGAVGGGLPRRGTTPRARPRRPASGGLRRRRAAGPTT